MRPYLAILKDSFREALASRILYIMLGLITLLLVVISPLTYRQELTIGLHGDDANWPEVIDRLKLAENETKPSPARRIWTLLSAEQQKKVRDLKRPSKQPKISEAFDYKNGIEDIARFLDEVARKPDLYDRPTWTTTSLSYEGRQLVAKGPEKLDESDKLRLNRILFEAAFPGLVHPSPRTSMQLRYAFVSDLFDPLPMSKGDFRDIVAGTLPFLLDKVLLGIGLFIAIVVTSPMIPQTFDPGSLHLLLSKPIARSFLYLTKFLGGCAFVVVCAAYLFAGLWLIAGVSWNIWEPRILMCIPIYTFVFATYYSVAALAGAFWRNSIVSIVVAAVFWLVCFGVGWGKIGLEIATSANRVSRIVPFEDQVIAHSGTRTPQRWDEGRKKWVNTFQTDEQRDFGILAAVASGRNLGPVYDPRHKQLVGATMSMSNAQFMVVGAKEERDWKSIEGPPAPLAVVTILNEPDGTPVIITNFAFYRITGEITPPQDKVKFLGYTLPSMKANAISDGGPRPAQAWGGRMAPALDPKTGLLTIYEGGEFTTLALRSGRYEQVLKKRVWDKESGRPRLAATGGTILLARGGGQLVVLDSKTLTAQDALEPEPTSRVLSMAASPSGNWIAVLFQNRRLWLHDVKESKLQLASVTGQGDISAIAFGEGDNLLAADRTDRVLEYDLADGAVKRRFAPAMSWPDKSLRYVITPIYTVCPKPGEFYKTVTHILSDTKKKKNEDSEEEIQTQADGDDPPASEGHPWAPVWSSAIFMAVMLAIGCAYMRWQEF